MGQDKSQLNVPIILGFGISGFRSFDGGAPQLIGPLSKMNVVIGQNNSGKSNVIRFIRTVYKDISTPAERPRKSIDQNNAPQLPTSAVLPYVPILMRSDENAIKAAFPALAGAHESVRAVAQTINSNLTPGPAGLVWVPFDRTQHRKIYWPAVPRNKGSETSTFRAWQALRPAVSGGSFEQHWLPEVLTDFVSVGLDTVKTVFIPAFRRIPSRIEEYWEEYDKALDGSDSIIETLSSYQNPGHKELANRAKFDAVETFLKQVLKRDISLNVAHDKTSIIVREYGRAVPLEALGTGIHQLLYLAVKAISHENAVVCIEEPELHFHPSLQRELINFLISETTNQYFITTHSAHIMDTPEAHVTHVRLEEGRSVLSQPMRGRTRWNICQELGYKPSDLMQANSVVWVEGPSDRIYLLWWLSQVAPDLVEGRHFSIMFYGGRLLSHVSVSDDAAAELIALLPINQHSAVLIDSDRLTSSDQINSTKQRIANEASQIGGLAWISAGREIENYVARADLALAIKRLHGDEAELFDKDATFGRGAIYRVNKRSREEKRADKVALARKVAANSPRLGVLDLEDRLNALADFIRDANRS